MFFWCGFVTLSVLSHAKSPVKRHASFWPNDISVSSHHQRKIKSCSGGMLPDVHKLGRTLQHKNHLQDIFGTVFSLCFNCTSVKTMAHHVRAGIIRIILAVRSSCFDCCCFF
jgi:hypothetical protein